ncbi:uncharacterized protein LOC122381306 [Amphibalanus amphitrite]|uniref:uncharacterized protein LOC122381306 n=1 Tax=Amphibalanus amphitrite TaxID=1232801 RepID=UPI001C9159F1|nr:uncharacterized protein LOC122381306 [Amphibalanus amphitrite]
MARWACCRLSEDLVTWRDQCSPPERPAHGGWLTLQPGCACCNSTDSAADQLLECICHGANITAVPQTLPGAVSLITLTMTNIVEVDRDDFLRYAAHLQDIVLSKNEQLRRIRADAFRNLPQLLSL